MAYSSEVSPVLIMTAVGYIPFSVKALNNALSAVLCGKFFYSSTTFLIASRSSEYSVNAGYCG